MISNSLRTFPLFSSMKEEAKSLTNFPLLSNICCCCWCSVISVVSDSVRPHRWQATRLHRPWDSPGKNTGVGCHFLLQCMKVKSESEAAQSCQLFATPWTTAYQAPPSMGFSRQEYWMGCHCLLRSIYLMTMNHLQRTVTLPSLGNIWFREKEHLSISAAA